jgi:MATE family multidrug resistance protein
MNNESVLSSEISLPKTIPAGFWIETRATGLLALPIIFGQVLQNSLSVIDTLMVGHFSVDAVAAASLATALFVAPLIFGFGLMNPFSVLVSAANARGETVETVHHLRRGLTVSIILGLSMALLIILLTGFLPLLHQPPAVVHQAKLFLLLLTCSLVPMYLFQTLKQYCEALHTAWLPMAILAGGVCLNIVLNWIFIFGHLGVPALGLMGAGCSTLISRTVMLAILGYVIARVHFRSPALRHALFHGSFRWQGYGDFLAMGLPAGFQVILEVGAFSFAAIMMGWISEAALAAQQVTISIAGTLFMIPLGLSLAVAIRVSHAMGSHDLRRARSCVRGSLLMTLAFMSLTAFIVCTCAHTLVTFFIQDPKVIFLAAKILFIAGLFQIFDGTQIVCVGALRGLHDIRFPTLLNFCGYWLIALPVSYFLAFDLQLGAVGIWFGLLVGLGIVSVVLLLRLKSKLDDGGPAIKPPFRQEDSI